MVYIERFYVSYYLGEVERSLEEEVDDIERQDLRM